MPSASQVLALLRSYAEGDDQQFLTIAMQMAAHEARQGHSKFARELRDLIDDAKAKSALITKTPGPVPISQPRGDLASVLSVRYPDARLSDMVLPDGLRARLKRILLEQRQSHRLLPKGLSPRRKLLLVGPPGSGKTMTASALAGELHLALFTILLEGLITRFLGETAAKLKLVFDSMSQMRGVYLFDEFDALGARRTSVNDVGEIRRVLNSFLQLVENDSSQSVIIAATNHPELLDKALFRRFDDVIEYALPEPGLIVRLFRERLANFSTADVCWDEVESAAVGLSQADVVRASDEAAKESILEDTTMISTAMLTRAIAERKAASS